MFGHKWKQVVNVLLNKETHTHTHTHTHTQRERERDTHICKTVYHVCSPKKKTELSAKFKSCLPLSYELSLDHLF